MNVCEEEAICIRHWDYSETSQTISLFSRSLGLVRAIAKGARRERGDFSGGVDLLTRANARLVLKVGTDLATLTNWSLIENFPNIRTEPNANKIAYFAADLIGRMFELHDPHPNMYGAFLHLLQRVGREADPTNQQNELILLDFQWTLLKECGLQPVLGSLQGGVDVGHFDHRGGGRVTEVPTETTWPVRVQTIDALKVIANQTGEVNPSTHPESIVRANRLLAAYLREIMGEEPMTMRVLFGKLI